MTKTYHISEFPGEMHKACLTHNLNQHILVCSLVCEKQRNNLSCYLSCTCSRIHFVLLICYRAYNCDVRYKPAQASLGNPSDGKACRAGCSVCNNDSTTPCPDGTNYSDPLQEFDPLESSNTSSQLTGNHHLLLQ